MRCLVTGAGGFIGGHLVKRLLGQGHSVRAVDIKHIDKWWQVDERAQNLCFDLRNWRSCIKMCEGIDLVYNLAHDMGGIGYIESHHADCMTAVSINSHMLQAAAHNNVARYFYSSSACVYRADKQSKTQAIALKEPDVGPPYWPEKGYGLEKLFSEQICQAYTDEGRLDCRVARFHNVYGPQGSWNDGREKAPAAISRKVAEAKLSNSPTIPVWGDGTNTRSYMYVDDCLDGIERLMASEVRDPINLGSSEMVSVDELILAVEIAAGYEVGREYDTTQAQGVKGRNSDNTKIRELLGWAPSISLEDGLAKTYPWIEEQVRNARA